MSELDTKQAILTSLKGVGKESLAEAAVALLECLGYRSQTRLAPKPNTADTLLARFAKDKALNPENALLTPWQPNVNGMVPNRNRWSALGC